MCRILTRKWKCGHFRRVTANCSRSFVLSTACPNKATWKEEERKSKSTCPYCVTKQKAEKKAKKLGIDLGDAGEEEPV